MFVSMLETEWKRRILKKFYRENRTKWYHIAREIVGNDADAEDAIHKGFMNFAKRYGKYRQLSDIELIRLCTAMIRNEAYDIVRKQKNKEGFAKEVSLKEDEIINSNQDILENLIQETKKSILVQAMMELSEEEREFLSLLYITKLQLREIEELFHISAQEVEKKRLQCRNKLTRIIQQKENFE